MVVLHFAFFTGYAIYIFLKQFINNGVWPSALFWSVVQPGHPLLPFEILVNHFWLEHLTDGSLLCVYCMPWYGPVHYKAP